MHLGSRAQFFLATALGIGGCAVEPAESEIDATAQTTQAATRGAVVIDFGDCIESIGVEVVPTGNVRSRVPVGFTLAGETAPLTPIVVRTAHCGGVTLNPARPHADANGSEPARRAGASVLQIGAIVLPPDGSGDVNVYTLAYYTDHLPLFAALRYGGIPAQSAAIDYRYRPQTAIDVRLYALSQQVAIKGSVGALSAAPVPFVSNWWLASANGSVKFSTRITALILGTADLTLKTDAASPLGQLLGGTSASFSVIEQFNGFSKAQARVDGATPPPHP